MNEYQEKLRSLGFGRVWHTDERKPVTDERDGSVGGYQIEHWDGAQSAEVHIKPVEVKAHIQEEE